MELTKESYLAALVTRHGAENQDKLCAATVGIAGLGGLGSNIAVSLARLGVGRLILVDFDRVDVTNLNRQQYRICDLGRPKPEALAEQLRAITPFTELTTYFTRVTPDNVKELFGECTILCEAFDRPDQKAMLLEAARIQLPHIPLVGASGMAGADSANRIRTERPLRGFYLCGDGCSDVDDGPGLMAPRVMACAAHEATMVMRLILGQIEP